MMLRTVTQTVAEKYKTLDDWKNNYKKLRTPATVTSLRTEILEKDRTDALSEISKLDALISIHVLIVQLEELLQINKESIVRIVTEMDHAKLIKPKSKLKDVIQDLTENKETLKLFNKLWDKHPEELTDSYLLKALTNITSAIHMNYAQNVMNLKTAEDPKNLDLLSELIRNQIFLSCAVQVYRDVDIKQCAGSWEIIGIMAPFKFHKYKLITAFMIIQSWAKLVAIKENMQPLWNEVILWLEGLHARTYVQLPPRFCHGDGNVDKIDGFYPLIEGFSRQQDADFRKHFGYTFYDMALYYLRIAESLKTVLPMQAPLPALEHPVETSPADGPSVATPSATVLALRPPLKKGKEPASVFDVSDLSSEGHNEEMPKAELTLERLKDAKDEDEEIFFGTLCYCLKAFQLNECQKALVHPIKDSLIEVLNTYINSWFTTHYVPTLFVSRPHVDIAKDAMEKLQESDSDANNIIILIQLWQKAKDGGSEALAKNTAELIIKSFKFLVKGATNDMRHVSEASASISAHVTFHG